MRKDPVPVIVFADIDSAPTRPLDRVDRLAALLGTLAAERITLVFCSHRTRGEIEGMRQAVGVFHPFVCENGGAAFVPVQYFGSDLDHSRLVGGYRAIEFASPHERVVNTLSRVARRLNLGVVGFRDMSVHQVARECGRCLLHAQLAKLREYGEAFRLRTPDPMAERCLLKALERAGLICVRRSGFYYAGTVPGAGAAIAALTALYRAALGSMVTVGIGEGVPPADTMLRLDVGTEAACADATRSRTQVEWLDRIVQAVGLRRREWLTSLEVRAPHVGRDVGSGRPTSKSP